MAPHALLELVLAFFRSPARHPELRDATIPLPADILPLLKIANGIPVSGLGLPAAAGEADLQAAARFFIEQSLLAPGADYYRLHGLPPGAGEEAIKEHHRLLMRLLHPDRATADRDWQFAAATRVNQAYAVLKDPERRRRYDQGLAVKSAPVLPRRRARLAVPDRDGDTPLRRWVWRHMPAMVMSGIFLLASAGVLWVWVSSPPSGALGGTGDAGQIVAQAPDLRPLAAAAVTEAVTEGPPEGQPEAAPSTPTVAGSAKTEFRQRATRTPTPPTPAPARPAMVRAGERVDAGSPPPVLIASPPPALSLRRSEDAPIPAAASVPPPAASESVGEASRRAAGAVAGNATAGPDDLLARFVQRYELGDLDAFMALFATDARHSSGGRDAIRRDYASLFDGSVQRRISVSALRWSAADDGWRGDGQFRASVQRRGEAYSRLYTGTLRLDLSEQSGELRISGLFHSLAGRSGE